LPTGLSLGATRSPLLPVAGNGISADVTRDRKPQKKVAGFYPASSRTKRSFARANVRRKVA